MMQLILADSVDAVTQAKSLLSKTRTQDRTDSKISAIIELIETIVVYKFPQLSREEIERMLGLSELKETKVYQEALHEGEQIGEQRGRTEGRTEGEKSLILRQLSRRVGTLPIGVEAQIQALDLPRLEALGEALLDFTGVEDLSNWLQNHS
jgi:predicted transposase YdaD